MFDGSHKERWAFRFNYKAKREQMTSRVDAEVLLTG